jgi:hypothetical protein
MTLPSAGGNNPPISLWEINNDAQDGFGLGYSLSAYRNQIYDNKSGGVGLLPSSSISISDFYGKRRVDSGANNSIPSGNYTVPPYRTITLYVYGGSGGSGGSQGFLGYVYCSLPAAGSGSAGGTSTCGSSGQTWYIVSGGGTGGGGQGSGVPAGSTGSSSTGYGGDGYTPQGATGSGSAGGNGGSSMITLTNPILGGNGPSSGSTVSFAYGNRGGKGSKGAGVGHYNSYTGAADCNFNGSNGNDGADGSPGAGRSSWT